MAEARQKRPQQYPAFRINPETARLEYVPVNFADISAYAQQQHGAVGGTLAAPSIPVVTPAINGGVNLLGMGAQKLANGTVSVVDGGVRALPTVGNFLFGSQSAQAAPAAAAAPAGPGGMVYTLSPQGRPATQGAARQNNATGRMPSAPTATQLEIVANNVAAPKVTNTRQAIASLFPNARITGGDRTSERNAQVGGSGNSWHLQPGVAIDMAPIPGESVESVKRRLEAQGFEVMEAIDETKKTNGTGPHWHFAARPKGSRSSSGSSGSGASSAQYSVADLTSALGTAAQLQRRELPGAPTEALPLDMPQLAELDKNVLMQELRNASQVQRRDRSFDGTDRLGAMLGAIAANMQGETDTVDMLLGMGAGAQAGVKSERELQEAKNKAEEDLIRELNIRLAETGLEIDTTNHATRNSNLDRTWQSGENQRTVGFNNLNRKYERDVAQVQLDQGVDQFNVNTQNQFTQTRAQLSANAMNQANSQNFQSNENAINRQFQLQIAGLKGQNGQTVSNGGSQILTSLGISAEPVRGEPTMFTNARVYADAVAGGNTEIALTGLAREMVVTQSYKGWLPEPVEAQVDAALTAGNEELATNLVNLEINKANRYPQTAVQLADFIEENANRGMPVARMWTQHAKAAETPAK